MPLVRRFLDRTKQFQLDPDTDHTLIALVHFASPKYRLMRLSHVFKAVTVSTLARSVASAQARKPSGNTSAFSGGGGFGIGGQACGTSSVWIGLSAG